MFRYNAKTIFYTVKKYQIISICLDILVFDLLVLVEDNKIISIRLDRLHS